MLQKGDNIDLTSDGFVDQANEQRKKIGSRWFKELLKKAALLPVTEQEDLLSSTFDAHRGNAEQRDDITVIGIQIEE